MSNFKKPYDPTNKGVLFVNNNPKKGPDSPEYIGSINVAGEEWTVFGRKAMYTDKKTGKEKPMLKLSVAVPLNANKKPAPKKEQPLTEDNWHDDAIPF